MSSEKWQPSCLDLNVLRPSDSNYASVNSAFIGSGNGLLHDRCKAITWINADAPREN